MKAVIIIEKYYDKNNLYPVCVKNNVGHNR